MTHVLSANPVTVSAADVHAARARIAPYVRHTPLERSAVLSEALGAEVFLKMEAWQLTGSFKPRVSFSKLLTLDERTRARGAVASTAGGHGIGLSYAARHLGVAARIHLPESADPMKIAAMRRNGATLLFAPTVSDARLAAQGEAEERGSTFVSAYNDPAVIAGGGTVGLEILDDLPEVDLLVAPVGGGGIISGMGVAMHAVRPALRVWGVMPELSPVLARWIEAGRPIHVDDRPSIADGLGGEIETDSLTFPLAQQHVDQMLLVSDDEIRRAMIWLFEEHQLLVEPSGAATVAALRKATLPRSVRSVVALITGRNISRPRFASLIGKEIGATTE